MIPTFFQLWYTQGVITAGRTGYDNRDDNYDDDDAVRYSISSACSIVKCQVSSTTEIISALSCGALL